MADYAIGDVHGCRAALETLLQTMPITRRDRLIFLGDLMDRGPDSKGVIDLVLKQKEVCEVVLLRGNHEVMMLESRNDPVLCHQWEACGGLETLESYGLKSRARWQEGVPQTHWNLLLGTQLYLETDRFIFVHGSVDAQLAMKDQDLNTLIWEKCYGMRAHHSGKPVICGHTPQSNGMPLVGEFGICLDTNASRGGWLTAFNPGTGDTWQSNQQGKVRTIRLTQFG